MTNEFTIENFPDDVYRAVGQIIKAAQELERDFKKLTTRLSLSVKNVNNSSLNKLNDALNKHGVISDDYYEKMKKVISIRNYVNHTFFIEDFEDNSLPFDEFRNLLGKKLSAALFMIFEAHDVISNISDALDGSPVRRPTVFGEKPTSSPL